MKLTARTLIAISSFDACPAHDESHENLMLPEACSTLLSDTAFLAETWSLPEQGLERTVDRTHGLLTTRLQSCRRHARHLD